MRVKIEKWSDREISNSILSTVKENDLREYIYDVGKKEEISSTSALNDMHIKRKAKHIIRFRVLNCIECGLSVSTECMYVYVCI